jgi:membrane fusion protein, multidrug efflux system
MKICNYGLGVGRTVPTYSVRGYWAGLAFIVAATVIAGCGGQSGQGAQQNPGAAGAPGRARGGAQAIPVLAEKATLKDVPIDVSAIGTVEAFLSVSVRAQVSGILLEARFKEGDLVHKGQVLFKIDSSPYEASLAQAKAALVRDRAVTQNNRSQAERAKKLLAEGVVPAQQVDQLLSVADASDATVMADEAAIRQAQLNLDYCTISSPLDGFTGKLQIQPGNLVNINTAGLVVLNQVSPIYVTFSVPQQYLGDIKRYMGQNKLAVSAAPPNDKAPPDRGTLEFVDNAVDPTTGTIRLRAQFDNQRNRLWPGLFVNASLRLSNRPNTLVVPSQAISTNPDGQFVYVVKADATVESRPIVAGASIEGQSIIEKGLTAGEVVVTDGQLRLVPGAHVQVTNRANAEGSTSDAAPANTRPGAD